VAEAIETLASARVVAERYFLHTATYVDMPCPAGTEYFAVECESDALSCTITATGSGAMDDFEYTLNEADLRTTAGPWAAGNGWTTRKGDRC
jgi:hypothetical protein